MTGPERPIHVHGDIEAANVVIGGVQNIAGDLTISVVRQASWSRPVAPNPPQHFTGRRDELDRLAEALRAGRTTAITGVQGMGGIGKTALALAAAAESGFGSVLWASLGPEPAAVGHLVSWARHADPGFTAGDSAPDVLAGRVRAALTGLVRDHCPGPVLVVLDDVWEGPSVDAARLLQLAAPAGAVFLITTRSQRVVAQLRSSRVELLPMTPEDALALLRRLLPDHPGIADEHLSELADVMGRHPLAMELAAGQARLLERPETELPDLVALYRGGVPEGSPFRDIRLELGESREDNLELVLSFSYAALSPEERDCFRDLGVLAYGAAFDRPLCAAVWDRDPKPPLDGLRHRAMLAIAPEPGWYQQHQLLRAYARALLRQDPPRHERTEDRYTAHVTAVCAGVDGDWRALDPLLPHVEEAGAILVGRPPGPAGLAFALATRTLLAQRKEVRHPEWLELGLAVATERMDRSYEVLFRNALGQDNAFRGDARAAVRHLHRARQVAESARDLAGMAATESNLGEFVLQSDPDTAPKHLWRAVSLHEELGDAEGLVDALLRIARWQANPYRGGFAAREEAFATLDRAEAVAAEAGLAAAVAAARAQAGALHDSLGDREAAETALADAAARFADLGLRDREADARVRLAEALASLGRPADAEAQLTAALPLVKSTGHAVAHAVALRNLGQLHARRGRPAEALACFAEALPLTRGQTERFADEDYSDDAVAVRFFTAGIDDVAKVDQVEHFRRAAAEDPRPALLPDELFTYLVSGTLRPPPDWPAALRAFAAAVGEPVHAAFATALADLAEGRPADLPEDHPYRPHVEQVAHRLASGGGTLTAEQALQCAQNTLLVLLKQPQQRREWTIELRALRRNAAEWGDEDDRDYFHALLAVLDNRLIALPDHNPHHERLAEVQEMLANFATPPARLLVERTVAAATVADGRRADWARALRATRVDAARRGERHEQAFTAALEALLLHGDEVILPDDNPYRRPYADAVAAVAAGRTAFAPQPPAELAYLADRVLAARTGEPKTFDAVVADLTGHAEERDAWGDAAGASVFRWLVDLLHDEAVGDPPDDALRDLRHEVAAARPRPCADDALPPDQVEGLAGLVVRARTDAPESRERAGEDLADYARVLAQRSDDWADERAFVAALRAVVDDAPVPDAGPYAPVVDRVVADIHAHRAIRAGGGVLTPGYLANLLRRTGGLWRAAQDTMADLVGAGDIEGALTGHRTRDRVIELTDWQQDLRQTRHRDRWGPAEAELLDALVEVTDSQPADLPDANPYAGAFREMLAAIDYAPGIPSMMVDSLASTREEFTERFSGLFTGRTSFLRNLDTMLDNTVAVLTTMPERAGEWIAQLADRRAGLLEHNPEDAPEIELVDRLATLTAGGDAALPADHPYADQLAQVVGGLALHRDGGPLPGAEVVRLAMLTAGAVTLYRDLHEPLVAELADLRARHEADGELVAFLDALGVVLDGRAVDLPTRNPYRSFLRMCQSQLRALTAEPPEPDPVM